jgi:GntR family transcriptional regulator/MocR family aminotransferase
VDRSNDDALAWTKGATGVADFLHLDPAEAPPGGLAAWLAQRLRDAVADGRLPVGTRLPASRSLADEIGVSRGLVVEAYRRLAETGQVVGRGSAGTVVVHAPAPPAPVTAGQGSPQPVTFADPGLETFDHLRAADAPVDLTPGRPDLASFPRAAWLRAERRVLHDLPPERLGYADPAGVPEFRAEVASWLSRFRGIRVGADEVVVVAGVAQALALLARALRARGVTEVAVEDPGSFGARRHLQHWGVTTTPVPVDDQGLDVAALVESGAPAVLVTPAHQFPTGVVLDGSRRRDLLAWSRAGGLVVEDDYDAEHRYDRAPVPALRSAEPGVCYTGSLSKTLAPALRVGWTVPPADLRDEVVGAKRDSDLGNATLPQLVLAAMMRAGDLEAHLRAVRRRHRRRRDAMTTALATHLPGARVHGAAAGLHLVVTLDPAVGSDVTLAEAALAAGVKVQPLSWHRVVPGEPGLVLGYAAASPAEIERGIAALGRIVHG